MAELNVPLYAHDKGSRVKVELDDDGGRTVWLSLTADDQTAEATLTPAEARAAAAALVAMSEEAER